MGLITYNGICSDVYGVFSQAEPDYAYPQRDYTITHIPGMNGDLYFDNNAYQNIDRQYKIAVDIKRLKSTEVFSEITQWLHSAVGYARLEDTYEPDYYRLGTYVENGSLQNIYDQAGAAAITFNCKPQRFLKVGEIPMEFTQPFYIKNPTAYESKPLITIYGTGNCSITIGDNTLFMDELTGDITLDTKIQNGFSQATNLNSHLRGTYPTLAKGDNYVTWTGNISKVEITPRWWTL